MTTSWNFQKLPLYTFYGGNVVRVLVSPSFSLPLISNLKASFSLSFSFSVFQTSGHDNYSKLNALDKTDTETISAFRFVFIDSSIASQVAGDYAISRQKKKLELHLGVWSRENKSLPKFLICIDNQIYTMRKLRY